MPGIYHLTEVDRKVGAHVDNPSHRARVFSASHKSGAHSSVRAGASNDAFLTASRLGILDFVYLKLVIQGRKNLPLSLPMINIPRVHIR